MVELIPLPYRGYGTSSSLDLRLNLSTPDNLLLRGRIIQLHPFARGLIYKYKLIEYQGDTIIERIFFTSKKIDQDTMWWKEESYLIYPIMCKTIYCYNSVCGRTFKYTQGILHYLQDYQSNEFHMSTFGPEANGVGYYIIPSPEEHLISEDFSELYSYQGIYDRWIQDDVDITELYPNLRWVDLSQNGLISLAQTDSANEITSGYTCIDANPIDGDWSFWELVNKLNEIAATDVIITVLLHGSVINVYLNSRYNLIYANDINYEMLVDLLKKLAYNLVNSRFSTTDWEKIVINKVWSEEIFIEVYESINPKVVSQMLYVDLPIFSLGTFGIQSNEISVPIVSSYI